MSFRPISLLLISILAACSPVNSISTTTGNTSVSSTPVAFAQVQSIFTQRCVGCHSKSPIYTGFVAPADGLDFTVPQTIKSSASRIYRQTVTSKSMPNQGNITGMTDAERAVLGAWIEQGAKLE